MQFTSRPVRHVHDSRSPHYRSGLRERLRELKEQRDRAKEAWIGPAQRHWAIVDIDSEIARIEEELYHEEDDNG